jgi:Predicted GTPase
MQVYTDGDEPMILEKGDTVRDFCKKIHRDFEERFKYARIWGKSTRYNGQFIGLEHVLKDGDRIRVELRR